MFSDDYLPFTDGSTGHIFQRNYVEHRFGLRAARRDGNASFYLDPQMTEYLQEVLKRRRSLEMYISELFMKYRCVLPRFLPKHRGVKKLLQDRLEKKRTRFCFRPKERDYWNLKLISQVAEVSMSYTIALMIWLEMIGFGEVFKYFRDNVVISSIREQSINTYTLVYNPFNDSIQKKFIYQQSHICV